MKREHLIGQNAIGGFPGHEYIHTSGEQICLNCKKTLKEIIKNKIEYCKYGIGKT